MIVAAEYRVVNSVSRVILTFAFPYLLLLDLFGQRIARLVNGTICVGKK